MRPTFDTVKLAGRCANGAERDRGSVWHALQKGAAYALCGKTYGRHSGGWSYAENSEGITCPHCIKKLAEHDQIIEKAATACENPKSYLGGPSSTRKTAWTECATAVRALKGSSSE